MKAELRSQADVASWLAAGLCLRRVISEDDDTAVAGAIIACASELPALPPPGVIADIAILLGGARPRDERDAAGKTELRTGAGAALLAEAYTNLARGARQCRNLVDDREVFAIDHLEVLGNFSRRLAADHIAAAAEALAGTLPRRLPANPEKPGPRHAQ